MPKENNSKLLKSNIRTLTSIILRILLTSQYCATALISYDNSLLYYDIDGRLERMLLVANCDTGWNRTKLVRTLMFGNTTGISGAQISSKDNLLLYQSDKESFIGPTKFSNSLKLPGDRRTRLPPDCVFVVDWMDNNIYYFDDRKLYLMDLYGIYDEQLLYDCQCNPSKIRSLTIELTFHFLVWIEDDKFLIKTDKMGKLLRKYQIEQGDILSLTSDPFKQRFIMIVRDEGSLSIHFLSYSFRPIADNRENRYRLTTIELPNRAPKNSVDWNILSTTLCLDSLVFVLKIDHQTGIVGKLKLEDDQNTSRTEYGFIGRVHIFKSMVYNLLDPCKECKSYGFHLNQTKCVCFCQEESCRRMVKNNFWLYLVWISIALSYILIGYALFFHKKNFTEPKRHIPDTFQSGSESSSDSQDSITEDSNTGDISSIQLSTPMVIDENFLNEMKILTTENQLKYKDVKVFKILKHPEKKKGSDVNKTAKKNIKKRSLKFIHHDHKIRLPKHKVMRYVSLVPIERRLQLIEKSLVTENSNITKSEKLRKTFFETDKFIEPSFKDVVKYSQLRTLVKHKYPEYFIGNYDRFRSFESLFGKSDDVEVVWSIYDKFKTDKLFEVQKFENEPSNNDIYPPMRHHPKMFHDTSVKPKKSKKPLNVCRIGVKLPKSFTAKPSRKQYKRYRNNKSSSGSICESIDSDSNSSCEKAKTVKTNF